MFSTQAQGLLGPFDEDALNAFSAKGVNIPYNAGILQQNKWTLLVFLSPECPLSKNYAVVIQQLATDFQNQIQVVGIIPGATFSKKEIRQFASKYKLSFPLVIDEKMATVKAVEATVTPEVVLMTNKASLIYRGAIDDWAVDLGKKRTKASREYLRDAIKQTQEGIPVTQKINQPVGCLINEF
jgi:thiol-disulfide isomerase/thioredoxin